MTDSSDLDLRLVETVLQQAGTEEALQLTLATFIAMVATSDQKRALLQMLKNYQAIRIHSASDEQFEGIKKTVEYLQRSLSDSRTNKVA